MIEAVMYGMMPSAKIVSLRKLPPLNRSKMPRTEPADWLNICVSTSALMPGVGICAPMRYTPSSASVNRTRFRKSGMRNMFWRASTNRFIRLPCDSPYHHNATLQRFATPLCYYLEGAARFGNLVLCRSAEGMRVNRELGLQFAVAQHLDRIRRAAHKTVRAEQLGGHCFPRRKNVQFFQIYDRVRHPEQIMKAALRHAAVQRHLAAFKSAPARIAAAGLLALVAGTGSLAKFRADTASDAHLA